MATYTVQSEGTHIVPYTLLVTFPVNIIMAQSNRVGSTHPFESNEFNAQMQIAADNIENYYKVLPDFTVQDQSRNVTWQCINPQESFDLPNLVLYDLVVSFTITNAEAQITITPQSNLTEGDLETFLQAEADNAAMVYKATFNWIDI